MEQRIAIGGLMRCCLETIRLYVQAGGFPKVGEKLDCKYCSDCIVATHDGDEESSIIWRWPGTKDERDA
jgi:hypothetical protein